MKIQPVASPHQIMPTGANSSSAVDARARAIAKLTTPPAGTPPPQAQATAVQNPNQVSPEEMSAIRQPATSLATNAQVSDNTQEQQEETAPQEQKVEQNPLSSQYAILARKEKALRAKAQQQEQVLKSREQALAAKEQEINKLKSQYEQGYISKQRLKESTLEALTEAEVPYDSIVQQLLDSQTPQDPRTVAHISKLEAKLAKLEAEATEGRQNAVKQQDEAYKAAISQITADARSLINSDPAFETIRATKSTKDVVELITRTFEEEGRMLSVEEAAEEVENHLVEEIDKLTQIEKIKKRYQANIASQSNTQMQTPKQPQQTQGMKTLTNATASTRQLSAKERAILAFKGELKS